MKKERISQEEDLQTRIILYLLKKSGIKKMFAKSGEDFKMEIFGKWRKPEQRLPAKFIREKYHVDTLIFHGMTCYKVYHKISNKAIVYVHGGGYVMEGTIGQWGIIDRLIQETGAIVYYPVYPLAPESDLEPTYVLLEEMYRGMLSKHKPSDILMMGDSAGGGIVLSFALLLKDKKLPEPKALFLLSPALRFGEVSEEEQKEMLKVEPKDIFLSPESFDTIGEWWRGNRDDKDYLVSPYYGDMRGLGHIYLYTGTSDILSIICKRFIEKMKREHIDITYEVAQDMCHCWMLFSIKKGKETKRRILEAVKKEFLN